MKRYLKLIMLILTASFFILACQDTSDSSNGSNSGIEDGGSGGNGDGGGSSLDSEIINATMRVSADENDALKNTFFSPAVATNGGKLQYTWNFGDDTESIDTDYNYVTHQFNKYGKTYTIKLLLNNMSSSQQETVTMDLSLPKPELSINCNTSGALIFCNPVISQQGIQDVSYTWNIFNSDGTLEKEILSTGSQIINHRVADSGTYKIVLKGTSTQVDGEMTAERDIYVSVNISQGQITYNNTSSDMLSYKYTFDAQAIDGSQLEYCWDFDGTARCDEGVGFQLGAQHSVADHTYSKYNAANTVTAFARIPGTNEVVSNSVIVQQALPEVSIKAEGTGLVRKLSPVFSFRPKGNISYIWKTGDGKEYSQETVNHTYIKNGTYTAELTVLNDLFAPEIGAVSAKPLNIYAYDNIQNVVIEYSRVSQSVEGETYTFSSPATSDIGKLYFTWKINNTVVAEGEDLSSINHTFTKYGQNASVSLDVKIINSNEIISAEPVLVQTSKPTAVLNPPANVTVDVPAEFKGEILSHLNGTDFTSNLINPQYKLEISNVEFKYSDTLTIPYTFIEKGTYSAKLVVTADNVEGNIISEPVTVQANEVIVTCRNEANPADIYSVKVICQMESIPDENLKYTLSYNPYIKSSYTTTEYASEEVSEIILYNKDYETDLYKYPSRDIVVNWEIYRDKYNVEYRGTYQTKFVVKEPSMGKVKKIMSNNIIVGDEYIFNSNIFDIELEYSPMIDGGHSTYALSENGYVYSWGEKAGGQKKEDYPVLTPKIVSSIRDEIVDMWMDNGWSIFKTNNGAYYIMQESKVFYIDNINEKFKMIKKFYDDGGYLITESRQLYELFLDQTTASKVDIGKISKFYYRGINHNKVYFLTDNNEVYTAFKDYSGYKNFQKLADNIQDMIAFNNLVTIGLDVFFKTNDGSIKDITLTNVVADAGSTMVDPKYYIGVDGKLYYVGQQNITNQDTLCDAGLGVDLSNTTRSLDIPEKVTGYVNGLYRTYTTSGDIQRHIAITESGNIYYWGKTHNQCVPKLAENIKIESKIKQVLTSNNLWNILLENGKLIVIDNLNPATVEYVNIPNDEKITKIVSYNYYSTIIAITENKNAYYVNNTTVNKINNLSNIKDIVWSSTYNSAIFITESNELYALGQNKDGILGLGDLYATETYTAVKIEGISYPIREIYYGYRGFHAGTEDGKIYVWGSNNGFLPVGHIFPQTTPFMIDVPLYKEMIPGGYRNNYFSSGYNHILTIDNDVYSWGELNNTGTNSKENISPNGYLVKPTKVN